MQIDGINGKMKCQRKHRQGRGFWMCRGLGSASPERVWAALWLRQSLPPKSGRCRVSGWPHGITGRSHVARLVPLRQRGNGSFRLTAAPAPWSLATILRNGMPTAWLYHKAGQMLHHNAISLPVCRCTFPPKKKAATLSLNASAQNILKKLFMGIGEITKPMKTAQILIL